MQTEKKREKEKRKERVRERFVRIRLLGLALGHEPPLPLVYQTCKDSIYLQALQSHTATAPEGAVTILWV
jgi:hypothetical protein